ncbi:MAG: 50S ribosomal protein L18 [Clostridiaceae bacterium]|jgi:large subunit ribosomal protein L18|nr:50S ribosomal protein L18 [Clostridiaceae bacterium]
MINKNKSNIARKRRHLRVRKRISGTALCPRLNVYRSLNNIYAQVIDDEKGVTLVQASTLDKTLKESNGGNKDIAAAIGKLVAERALSAGIKRVVFDRGGYLYHGRVKSLAEGAREGGLEF